MPSDKWEQYAEGGTATAAKADKWDKYAESSSVSPIAPPKLQRPQPQMSEVYLLGGDPKRTGIQQADEFARGAIDATK